MRCSSSADSGQNATSDASPADHDDTATSRLGTCASSCATTARSSAGVSTRSSPSVQHTAAERALYPTVSTLGCTAGDTNSRGTGSRAAEAQLPDEPVQLRALHLTDGAGAKGSKHRTFRMKISDPANGEQARALDDGEPGSTEPDGTGEQGSTAQRAASMTARSP